MNAYNRKKNSHGAQRSPYRTNPSVVGSVFVRRLVQYLHRLPPDFSCRGDWPQMRFEWVDIEDESELAGDLDVETFPTLLIADAHKARFLGPLLPHAAVLSRLIGSLRDAGPAAEAQVDPEAQALFSRVRSARA